jgi:hypothetical protein
MVSGILLSSDLGHLSPRCDIEHCSRITSLFSLIFDFQTERKSASMSRDEQLMHPITANTAVGGSPLPEKVLQCDAETDSRSKLENLENHSAPQHDRIDIVYLTGSQFWLVVTAYVQPVMWFRVTLIYCRLALSLFLTNLEIPIVTTSLVAITNDLGEFNNIGWVISSYLLGYVGVLVIFAKLSDIFGRKLLLGISISIFIVFSGGCGAAQTTTQLSVVLFIGRGQLLSSTQDHTSGISRCWWRRMFLACDCDDDRTRTAREICQICR